MTGYPLISAGISTIDSSPQYFVISMHGEELIPSILSYIVYSQPSDCVFSADTVLQIFLLLTEKNAEPETLNVRAREYAIIFLKDFNQMPP